MKAPEDQTSACLLCASECLWFKSLNWNVIEVGFTTERLCFISREGREDSGGFLNEGVIPIGA